MADAPRPLAPADLDWVRRVNADHYQRIERFDATIATAIDRALADFAARADRSAGLVLDPCAGSLLLLDEGAAARLKLVWLAPSLRGRGQGAALLAAAVGLAAQHGFTALRVSTFDRHAGACRMYARAGFAPTARQPVRAFGHDLVQVDFALSLAGGTAP